MKGYTAHGLIIIVWTICCAQEHQKQRRRVEAKQLRRVFNLGSASVADAAAALMMSDTVQAKAEQMGVKDQLESAAGVHAGGARGGTAQHKRAEMVLRTASATVGAAMRAMVKNIEGKALQNKGKVSEGLFGGALPQ